MSHLRLAIDTSGDLLSVAIEADGRVVSREVPGARQHAAALLPAIEAMLADLGAARGEIREIVLADGPGSFTGLRVGAAVAKALVESLGAALRVAPALAARAVAALAGRDGVAAAVADALRGDCYVGVWQVEAGKLTTLLAPTVRARTALADALAPFAPGVTADHGGGAAALLALTMLRDGVTAVADVAGWEPTYGRPAEAQARWEEAHGRPVPAARGVIR